MTYYRRLGDIPPKRHTQFRRDDGGLHAEELMGQDGFSGVSALLYHRRPPTALVAAEDVADPDLGLAANRPLLPRHLRTRDAATPGDLVTGRTVLLANDDLRLAVAAPTEPSGLYRNATGDELVYVRRGRLRLETTFGVLDAGAGDYVVVPTGTTHRWVPGDGSGNNTGDGTDHPAEVLVIEARGHVGPPARYLSSRGQFLEHSPFCERDLHGPTEPFLVDDAGETDVLVRHRGGLTRHRYAHHPFDVVGWDGCLYPYRFSIHDFEPITGRVHQPPPVHQTFAGPNFVVCSFVPRLLDYHPQAVPVPYNHSNTDSDEVLYYCDGDFTSRKGSGIGVGSISLHPAGFTHGPQPGSVEAGLGQERTGELAVMVDTFRPLLLSGGARACEDESYPWTWSSASAGSPDPASSG